MPGDPDRRALDAMAAAVHRARRGPDTGEPQPTEQVATESTSWHLSAPTRPSASTAKAPSASTTEVPSTSTAAVPSASTTEFPVEDGGAAGEATVEARESTVEETAASTTGSVGSGLPIFDELGPAAPTSRQTDPARTRGNWPPGEEIPPTSAGADANPSTTFSVEAEVALAGLPVFDDVPVLDDVPRVADVPVLDDFEPVGPRVDPSPERDWPADATALAAARPDRVARPAPQGRERRRTRTLPSRHAVEVAVVSVSVAILLAGGLAAGLSLSSSTPSTPARSGTGASSSAGTSSGPGHGGTGATRTGTTGSRSSHPKSGATASTTTGATAPTRSGTGGANGAPHLQSVKPASGASGQSVTVSGSGLYSTSGEITAYIGGAPAPTSCSSQTTCTVTVPDLGRPRSTTLVIETASGSSNAVAFDYT